MIDYRLTEEQVALQEMAREFARKEMAPNAAKFDQGHEFPWEIMQKAFDAGFMTGNIPEQYGGGGLNNVDTALISEELAKGCPGMFTSIMEIGRAHV